MTGNESNLLTPGQMAERTGVTIDTLRYYERENLLVGIERSDSGHRRYSENDIGWVEVLRCLRLSGMTIEQLRGFAALGQQGPHTEPERYRLLVEHRAEVEASIAELQNALTVIDHKMDVYRDSMSTRGMN